jgi:autotransporter family porin
MRRFQNTLPIGDLEGVASLVCSWQRMPPAVHSWISGFLVTTSLTLLSTSAAFAACVMAPTAGNDTFICDSGDSGGSLTDTGGNNTLNLPAGGTGQISGNVTFGAGTDHINMQSGTITGAVDQGNGADFFVIGAGTVAGNVQQGAGIATVDVLR